MESSIPNPKSQIGPLDRAIWPNQPFPTQVSPLYVSVPNIPSDLIEAKNVKLDLQSTGSSPNLTYSDYVPMML